MGYAEICVIANALGCALGVVLGFCCLIVAQMINDLFHNRSRKRFRNR